MKQPNYCTFFPEGDWSDCCYVHDEICILSKEYLSWKMRLLGDLLLYKCVKSKGRPIVAAIMYSGVTFWAFTFWWFGYFKEKYFG